MSSHEVDTTETGDVANGEMDTVGKEYTCSLLRKVFRPGSLFISENSFRFTSKVLSEDVFGNFKDVANITRDDSKTKLGVLRQITISMTNGDEYQFSNFFKSDEAYALLQHWWGMAMRKRLHFAQSLYERLDQSEQPALKEEVSPVLQEIDSILNEIRLGDAHFSFRIPKEQKLLKVCVSYLVRRQLCKGKIYLFENFLGFFTTGEEEHVVVTVPYQEVEKLELVPSVGFVIIIREHPLDLSSDNTVTDFFVDPIVEDNQPKRRKSGHRELFFRFTSQSDSTQSYELLQKLTSEREKVVPKETVEELISFEDIEPTPTTAPTNTEVQELPWDTVDQGNDSQDSSLLDEFSLENAPKEKVEEEEVRTRTASNGIENFRCYISTAMLGNNDNFSIEYMDHQSLQLRKWKARYLEPIGYRVLMRNKVVKHMIRSRGLPDQLRGPLWCLFSGAWHNMIVNKDYYRDAVKNLSVDKNSLVNEEIEKDLYRSFPAHERFQKEAGIAALRRILNVYALKNEEIGYCQAMNIIASIFLVFMPEEHAFWMLSSVCELFVADYYHRSLVGTQIDEVILKDMVDIYLPRLSQHFKKLEVSLALVTQPWFLCLFIGYVPLEVSLCILDWFFYDGGSQCLLSVALAILTIKQEAILQEEGDGSHIILVLREKVVDPVERWQILELAFKYFDSFSMEKINQLRNKTRHQVILNMENTNKKKSISKLMRMTKFNRADLEYLYSAFQSGSGVISQPVDYIEYEQFQIVFMKLIPEWKNCDSQLVDLVFQSFDVHHRGRLDFEDFIRGMEVIRKGTFEDQFQYCMKLYTKQGKMLRKAFRTTLTILLRLHTPGADEDPLILTQKMNSFTRMVFEELDCGPEDSIEVAKITPHMIQRLKACIQ